MDDREWRGFMIKTHCRSSRFMLTARCKYVFVLILLFPFQTPIILKCDFTGSISPSTLLNSHDHGSGYAARTSHELECVEKIALNQSANVSKIQTQTVSYASCVSRNEDVMWQVLLWRIFFCHKFVYNMDFRAISALGFSQVSCIITLRRDVAAQRYIPCSDPGVRPEEMVFPPVVW